MKIKISILFVFLIIISFVDARICQKDKECIIGDFLLNDTDVPTYGECLMISYYPNSTLLFLGQTQNISNFYYQNFTLNTTGTYLSYMNCTGNASAIVSFDVYDISNLTNSDLQQLNIQNNITQILTQTTQIINNITFISNQTTQILNNTIYIQNQTTQILSNLGNISQDLSTIRNKVTDNVFTYFSIPSGQLYINSTQIFSLYLTNNSIMKPIDSFTISIYNKSGQLEQSKSKATFNNQENEYWQTFTFTNAGEYRAVANITYNGLTQVSSRPFTVQSLAGQFDINVVCPQSATFGQQITCTAYLTRMSGQSGDAYIKYYIEGQSFQTTTIYINLGENKSIQLSDIVNVHGIGRFVVQETNQVPAAEGSATFQIIEQGGSDLVYRNNIKEETYINKVIKEYKRECFIGLFIMILTIIIIVVVLNKKN